MKKILLIAAMAFSLGSCQEKEADQVQPSTAAETVDLKLQGTWIKAKIRIKYFDAAGVLIYESFVDDENGEKYVFSNGQVVVYENDGKISNANYQVSGMILNIFAGSNQFDFLIAELESGSLRLESKYDQLQFGNGQKAATAIFVEEFKR